jgi:hypothetical protein
VYRQLPLVNVRLLLITILFSARLQKMKTKFEEDAKRSRAVQVAKHDEALLMITQLRKENEWLKEEIKIEKHSGMNTYDDGYQQNRG